MLFCGFCGKGPFPATSALNKHIRHSVKCNQAARQKWCTYSKDKWKDAPGPSNVDQLRPLSPPVLKDNEVADIRDITFEDDLLGLENDVVEFGGTIANTPPVNGIPPELPEPQVHPPVTVENVNDRSNNSEFAFFVEEFPAELGAGAVWGEDIPFFERVLHEQVEYGLSRWSPFDDQDEWELAMWLIRNVGHNQITAFLKLNVVGSYHFLNLTVTVNV